MSKSQWEQLVKYEELELILRGQMYIYLSTGRGIKAMKLLGRIHRKVQSLCQPTCV